MKPTVKLATAQTPDGGEMVLYHHDQDFSIRINGFELMQSRRHESELELARLGCARLVDQGEPSILIGGLGMGYTLRQALDMVGPRARVVVGELLGDVIEWNRLYLGELNDRAIEDPRVDLRITDIVPFIASSRNEFDAILLDIDNGPGAITDTGNRSMYDREGIESCRDALRERGCLAVWSTEPSKKFEKLMKRCGFHVRLYRASAHKGSRSQSRCVWVASEDFRALPSQRSR